MYQNPTFARFFAIVAVSILLAFSFAFAQSASAEEAPAAPVEECEIEGHKYDEKGNPLSNWVMGLMKIRTYTDESTEVFDFDLAEDTTNKDGYYCLEWDGVAGLPANTDTPYSFVYHVYETLKAGWSNISIEKGTQAQNNSETLTVVDDADIRTQDGRVSTQVFDKNGFLPANTAYHADFYNKQDDRGDDGDDDDGDTVRYTLTISLTGAGEGHVLSDVGGISCYSTGTSTLCSATYLAGTNVALTATPETGSNFDGSWVVASGTCTGTTSPCGVTMTSNVALTAHFGLTELDTNSNGGGGGGSSSGSGNKRKGLVRGDSTSNNPIAQVLGESTSTLPAGAPNTGGGATSPVSVGLPSLVAILTSTKIRSVKNV